MLYLQEFIEKYIPSYTANMFALIMVGRFIGGLFTDNPYEIIYFVIGILCSYIGYIIAHIGKGGNHENK